MFITLITLITLITACGSSPSSDGGETKDYFADAHPEVIALYEASCIYCHASDLRGHVGESSNLQTVGARRTKEEIIDTIRNGKGQMPAQSRLSEEEIERLADWLITLK